MVKKKRNLPKLSIFPHEFVIIYWVDIESDSGWRQLEDVYKDVLPICVSSGWLVKADDEVTRLVSDFNLDSDGKIAEVGSTTIIPTCVIREIIKVNIL